MDFFKEFAGIVIDAVKTDVMTGAQKLLDFANGYGAFAIAIAIILSIALFVFAKNSFRVYRVALPLSAIVLGSWAASKILTRVINFFFPSVAVFIDPAYLIGIFAALVLAVFCIKYYKCATVVVGGAVGLLVIVPIAELFFNTSDIVRVVFGMSSPRVVEAFYLVLTHACVLLTAFIFYKWFKQLYIFFSSVLGAAASFGVLALFTFKSTDFTVLFTLVACAIGSIFGLVFAIKQFKRHKNDYKSKKHHCDCCEA